jgi:glycosyltransferase involved in cell wall biosynthesis
VSQEWQIDPKRVEVIPNSIDIPRVIDLGTKQPIPDRLKNKEYLLYFGRLEERKGVRVLAHALPSVLDRFPKLNMVFVGSDSAYQGASMREYIRQSSDRYTNRVMFIENLPHENLFPIVHSAKMVILPSLWEAFGFVCVEALALGRPVIATSGSGFEEIIEDEISGYLVEPGNSDLLAENITRRLSDEAGLFRISQGARRRALDFDVSKIARRLLDYYESVRSRCTAGTAGPKTA